MNMWQRWLAGRRAFVRPTYVREPTATFWLTYALVGVVAFLVTWYGVHP